MRRLILILTLFNTLACSAVYHRIRYWEFSKKQTTHIDRQLLEQVSPGETTERELLRLMGGKYFYRYTFTRPMPRMIDGVERRIERKYVFMDSRIEKVEVAPGVTRSGETERIEMTAYLHDDRVIHTEVSHRLYNDSADYQLGELDRLGELTDEDKRRRRCEVVYYRHYSLGMEQTAEDLSECGIQ